MRFDKDSKKKMSSLSEDSNMLFRQDVERSISPGRFHHTLARRIHWCRVTIDPRWTLGLVPWFSQLFGVLRAACKHVTIQLDETIITLFLTCRHWSFPNFIDSGPLLLNNSTVSSNDLFCTVTSNLSYFPPKFVSPERSYGDIYLLSKLWIEWSFCGLYVSYEWVQFIVLLLGNIFLQMIKYFKNHTVGTYM